MEIDNNNDTEAKTVKVMNCCSISCCFFSKREKHMLSKFFYFPNKRTRILNGTHTQHTHIRIYSCFFPIHYEQQQTKTILITVLSHFN